MSERDRQALRGMARRLGEDDEDRWDDDEDAVHWGQVALLVLGFAILFFATAFYFDTTTKAYKRAVVPVGVLFGPIETKRRDQIAHITTRHFAENRRWAFIEGVVLKDKKTRITSFGGEYFHESGYDADGPWSESEVERDVRVVLPSAGRYWIQFVAQGGRSGIGKSERLGKDTKVELKVELKRGGSTILNVLGLVLLVVAVIMNEVRNRTLTGMLRNMNDDD